MVKARSYGQNQKLVRASFAKLQFWTERKRVYCMHLKTSNESTLLDLRVLKGGLQVGKRVMGIGASKNRVAVQITKLDQNAKEGDSLKFFKEHHWVLV